MRGAVVGGLTFLLALTAGARAVEPGATIDAKTVEQVKDLLPPEIYAHFQKGEYTNQLVDFPDSRWQWDDGFEEATKWNAEHLVLDEHKAPVDKATGNRPDYIRGLPFPNIDPNDPDAGYKALWNMDYAYYAGGNSHNWTELNWVSRRAVDRSSTQDVYFLYYDGQPRQYSPPQNPQNLLFQFLAVTASPADLQGTASLGYRFKDPTKRDLSWAYVPALRRIRAVSPANRSDGFLGSDQSQDDGFFFDGKPEDFEWKVVGHKEGLRFVDGDSIAGKVKRRGLPSGGWRTDAYNNDRTVGYMVKDWKGLAWAPVVASLAKRRFWVLQGVPKDKYYLYGKLELWIDDHTWQGAWNRKFSWQGELLNVYQVTGVATVPFNEHERWWGSTFGLQLSENVKQDRATASGMNGPGNDPANDRRITLEPRFFDYQTLNRFGK
ncbi:MAG TPA: outer membrane lipoprotein-sorting protein [Candidatus Binatia bacterium]|nr:outer membrane lipoprotein-sorting protein [Candidatus Binatia bacterium]